MKKAVSFIVTAVLVIESFLSVYATNIRIEDVGNRIAIAEKNGITIQVPIGASYIIKDGQQI